MKTLRLPQLAWYGTRDLELPIPSSWQLELCHMAGDNRSALKSDEIKAAITSPIGMPPIRDLARGKKEVVIVFDDMSRVTRIAEIVPFVLEELAAAGITDDNIRFIMALGSHGAANRLDFEKKLGREVVASFPVYNHNPFNNCIRVGTTSYGVDVCLNAEVVHCDFKIAVGSVVPHPNTGFGGGGKIILPGVAAMETIEHFHRVEGEFRKKCPGERVTGVALFDKNPLRLNSAEAMAMAGLDIKIDCLLNAWGEIVAIFAGAPQPAYEAAIAEARRHYLTPAATGKPIVVANTFAKANEAVIVGLNSAFKAASFEGSDVVLIANAPDGPITHYLLGSFGKTIGGNLRLRVKIPRHVDRLIIYNEYPEVVMRDYFQDLDRVIFMHNWGDVLQILQKYHGADTKITVFPNADIQYFSDISQKYTEVR